MYRIFVHKIPHICILIKKSFNSGVFISILNSTYQKNLYDSFTSHSANMFQSTTVNVARQMQKKKVP